MPKPEKRSVLAAYISNYIPRAAFNELTKLNKTPEQWIEDNIKRCNATSRTGERCELRAVKNKSKCVFHGGLSTGPKTEAGKKKALANLKQYRNK